MVFETRERTGEKRDPLTRVAQQLGINPQTLRTWVQEAEVDAGHSSADRVRR
jgi:transposase